MDYIGLIKFLKKISKEYVVRAIGKTYLNNNIYAVYYHVSKTKPWAIITAGIHAREHISTDIVCKEIKYFKYFAKNVGYNVAFIPLINPDGANLCKNGLKNVPKTLKKSLLNINNSTDFSLYKANIRGVDLNNNFDANWCDKHTKTSVPSSQGYYGPMALSEKESRALASFTKQLKPFITISYHMKGEEIYYDFFQTGKNKIRDKMIAEVFADSTGYKIKSTQNFSSGGYKDWCVQKLKIPALTIELGEDKFSHPYPKNQIHNIWAKNKNIFLCLEKALKIYNKFGENK